MFRAWVPFLFFSLGSPLCAEVAMHFPRRSYST